MSKYFSIFLVIVTVLACAASFILFRNEFGRIREVDEAYTLAAILDQYKFDNGSRFPESLNDLHSYDGSITDLLTSRGDLDYYRGRENTFGISKACFVYRVKNSHTLIIDEDGHIYDYLGSMGSPIRSVGNKKIEVD